MSSNTSAIASSTEYFGYLFSNLGPLTTTYTAPKACETVDTDRVLFVEKERGRGQLEQGQPKCWDHWPLSSCIPSGTAIDNWVESTITADTGYPNHNGAVFYHSPGIHCPSGWTTVGMIAKGEKTLSMSGYMTESYEGQDGFEKHHALPMPPTKRWDGFLKPYQTVAFCGPIGYAVDPAGWCRSTVGDYTDLSYSTWCKNEAIESIPWTYNEPVTISTVAGETFSPGFLSWVSNDPIPLTTSHVTMTGSEYRHVMGHSSPISDLAVITRAEVIPLVFEQSDLDAAGITLGGSETKETGTETTVAEETGTKATGTQETNGAATETSVSAAPALSVRGLVPVVTVLVGMLAGAGLFSPW